MDGVTDLGGPRRLTLLTPHFAPETGAGARRWTSLAMELRDMGWSITVVTLLPHHPAMRIAEGYDVPTPFVRSEDGLEVVRVRPRLASGGNLAGRLLGEARFAWRASALARSRDADVIVASSPYFFLGPAGAGAAHALGRPFVWDVRDLTWLYPKATGRRTFGLDRLFDAWMRRAARRATAVVTTSEAQLAYFGDDARTGRVIPNGVTPSEFERFATWLDDPRLPGPPRLVYVGLFGFMHGLETLLDVAEALPDTEVHLYGDGPERPRLEAASTARSLRNFVFHGHVGSDAVTQAYRHADILLAPLRDREAFRMIQPAKVWEYLATGRPVVHTGRGETARIMAEHQLGWVVDPESGDAIVRAVRSILDAPDEARRTAHRARAWIGMHRNRHTLARQWHELLRDLAVRGH